MECFKSPPEKVIDDHTSLHWIILNRHKKRGKKMKRRGFVLLAMVKSHDLISIYSPGIRDFNP